MITYESCFTEKVNTYSCERTMKEYVHGLFTTEVYVSISLLQTELTGIVMEEFIQFYKPQWFKIYFLDFIMIKKCCACNDVAAFAKLSHVTVIYTRTATDGNMSMMEKGFFAVATYWR